MSTILATILIVLEVLGIVALVWMALGYRKLGKQVPLIIKVSLAATVLYWIYMVISTILS